MFFFATRTRPQRGRVLFYILHAVRQRALNGDAGRVTIFVSVQECPAEESVSRPPRSSRSISFPPRRLVVEDSGLSIRATPVQVRPGRPNFLKEAPVLDPRPGNVLPYRPPTLSDSESYGEASRRSLGEGGRIL